MRVAVVALAEIAYNADKPYHYSIPSALAENLVVGVRILVPFGRNNKLCQALVLEIGEETERDTLKEVSKILDSVAVLTPEQIKLAEHMKERLFCTYFEAAKLMLPAGGRNLIRCSYSVKDAGIPLPKPACGELLQLIAESGSATQEALEDQLGAECLPLLDRMVQDGILKRSVRFSKKVKDVYVKFVSIADLQAALDYCAGKGSKKEKHLRILEALQTEQELSIKELCYRAGCGAGVVNTLVKLGLLEIKEKRCRKNSYERKTDFPREEVVLNEKQQEIFEALRKKMQEGAASAALLHGVTGSGKTLIYLKLAEFALSTGKTAMVLVPEIALTAQLTDRFFAYFKNDVAVIHSGLSQKERLDQWQRIHNGEAHLVLGTRSAVFAPLENLGVLIIDEEHEHTYKSDTAPKYHARDIARLRCFHHHALLLLCSATPSMESYSMARAGKYQLYTLEERYNQRSLPNVMIADMRREAMMGNTSIFSHLLLTLIEQTVDRGEQVVLFLNKRGYNTFVSCKECGYVVKCPHCSVSMTYHRVNRMLLCHYCGEMMEMPTRCPDCGSDKMKQFGIGTQKVEEDLLEMPKGIRVLRMDMDTVTLQKGHEEMIADFKNHAYDVLLGTQMVAKGLDIPNVTLVGVVSADASLFSDNFRANERTFSLLTQVVGRAGRAGKDGVAVIQTFCPDSRVIALAKNQDYRAFYDYEIEYRKVLAYPPFCDVYQFNFSGEDEQATEAAALWFHSKLCELLPREKALKYRLFDPVPAPVYKIKNKYRYKVLCKCRDDKPFRFAIDNALRQYHARPQSRKVILTTDPNAQNFS